MSFFENPLKVTFDSNDIRNLLLTNLAHFKTPSSMAFLTSAHVNR